MTDSQKAALEIWRWTGSPECEDLVASDMSSCEHQTALRTPSKVDDIAIERIRQIIDKWMC